MSDHIDDCDRSETLPRLKRRTFINRGLGSAAVLSLPGVVVPRKAQAALWPSSSDSVAIYADVMQAVVVGSGFGGAVTACRLAKKWPGKVMIVERGKRYGRDAFPRQAAELQQGFWNVPGEDVPRLLPSASETRGVFDLRSYGNMDTLIASGWGGGSLLYANALIQPISPDYDASWPAAIQRDALQPYYDVHAKVMGATEVPRAPESERLMADRFTTSELIASGEGVPTAPLKVGVFFGNDPQNPTPMGQSEINLHGAVQSSCSYCAECIIGCNNGAKNSLDYNYLYVAENKYGARTQVETKVDKIVPLDQGGAESRYASGEYGYHVYLLDMATKTTTVVKTQRVILAAGVFGSTEILLRNKSVHRTLINVSGKLGKGFSGNGDFINLALFTEQDTGSDNGPTLTDYIDFNAEVNPQSNGFIAEHMSIPPNIIPKLIEVLQPGPALKEVLLKMNEAVNSKMIAQLTIGKDSSDGQMSLHWLTKGLRLSWPYYNNYALYNRMIDTMNRAKDYVGGKLGIPFPTWLLPSPRNLTVHGLGGCVMADSASQGVVSSQPGSMGQVFNYANLYVADGSVVPNGLGVNPALTIGAIAELIAEDITGIAPSAVL